MKRRKFFKAVSYGATGLALATGCKSFTSDSGSSDTGKATKAIVPDYRNSIKTAFTTGKTKSANDKVILALIGSGSWGTNLILEAANSGENILIKYVCDVDDTRGGRAISELEKIQGVKPIAVRYA
jgi:hypothetical protein